MNVLRLFACLLFLSTTLEGQRAARAGYAMDRSDRLPAPTVTSARADVHVLPAVSATGAPRSVQLVNVPVPHALRSADSVIFSVVRTSGATVAGAESGRVRAADGRVMLSVSVPSHAMAGRMRIAEVSFRTEPNADVQVIVPIEVLVSPVYATHIRAAAPMIHAVQGRQTTARIVLANSGNVHDTVQLELSLPGQWRAHWRDAPSVIIAPGTSVVRDLEITAPRQHVPGSSLVSVRAIRMNSAADHADSAQRVTNIPVEVLPSARSNPFGPALGVSYSALMQPGLSSQSSWGLTLSGPLAADITMHAAWTQRAVFGSPGLARVGGGQLFPSASFSHPRWSLSAGNASADLGDVAGLLRNGRGVSGSYGDSVWQFTAMAARPFTLDVAGAGSESSGSTTRYAGVLAGLAVRTVQHGIAWTTSVSHLRDPLLMRSQLDAVAIGAARTRDADQLARGEVAWRRWQDGVGIGAAAEFGHRSAQSDWRLRATHAPGGSRAFARAQTDVTLTGAQAIGALRVGYVGYYASDEGIDGATLATRGVSLMPQWRLGHDGSVGLEARVGDATSGDARARLGTQSSAVGVFGSRRVARLTATSSATYTRLARDLAFGVTESDRAMGSVTDAGIDSDDTETMRLHESQLVWTTQLLLPLPSGMLDAYTSLQRRLGADALSDGQFDMMLRAEQLALPFVGGRVLASAAIGRTLSLTSGTGVLTKRVGVTALLPLETYLRLDVESNPWARPGGTSGWSTALRMERSFGTPEFLRGGRGTGVVFEDVNGNGVRDAGERGLPGVVVRVGSEVVVTDRGGAYQLSRAGGGMADVDERSLPFGLMLAQSVSRAMMAGGRDGAGRGAQDIAVLPVGSLEVRLELVADSVVQRVASSFDGVRVTAVDMMGRRHIARVLPDGRALFEALPPGDYRLEIDGSGAREPLSVQGGALTFRIDGQQQRQTLRVQLGPRSVRMFRASPAAKNGSAARP